MFSKTTLERVSASVPRGDVMRSPPWLPVQMWPRLWQLRLASLQMCCLEREGRHENRLRGNLNLRGGQAEPEPLRRLLHLLFLGSSSRIWFVFPSFPSVSFLPACAAYVDQPVFPHPCSRPADVLWRGPRGCFGPEKGLKEQPGQHTFVPLKVTTQHSGLPLNSPC